jgi:hypothetical protein
MGFAGCRDSMDAVRPQSREYQQDDVRIVVSVDRSVTKIAEPCHVTVSVSTNASKEPPVVKVDEKTGTFTTIDVKRPQLETVDGRISVSQEFVFECYKSGQQSIPSLTFETAPSTTAANEHFLLRSDPVPMRVLSSVSVFDDPRRYYDDVNVIYPPRGALFYAAVVGVTLMALAALALALRPFLGCLIPARSPLAQALQQLDFFDGSNHRRHASAEAAIVAADTILRRFLQRHWRISAAQLTKTELIWISEWPDKLDGTTRADLEKLLQTADEVKFGQVEATMKSAAHALSATRAMISKVASKSHRNVIGPQVTTHV